ncbi:MAG TPA: hypothetical protein VH369_04545 [Bryobacteraceae bacterium]
MAAVTLASSPGSAIRIRRDDPIWREPAPISVGKLSKRQINDTYDQLENMFLHPGRARDGGPERALETNTLDEVPDSAWYTNRHGRHRMTMDELLRGPGNQRAPAAGPWTILGAKNEGVTPGFVIRDRAKHTYLLKFDTPRAPNSTTASDVIGSKIFYALGYNTPENYIVTFARDRLEIGPNATVTEINGAKRPMAAYDVERLLEQVYRREDGSYRALASLYITGDLLGPWLYYGTRSDDPNDIYAHENRRDLRGLYVFAAWLNHYDATSLNTLDTVVEENGTRFVRHYLIDFGSILGSSAVGSRDPRDGFVYQYDFGFAWKEALSFGLYAPEWQRADYPELPEAGRFESETFDPLNWKPIYQNPAFENRLPDDTYWAAKQVMAFTNQEIRRLVETGEYEDPKTIDYLTRILIERRDKIGRAFLSTVLPLDGFAVRNGRLTFEDLAVKYGFREPLRVKAAWFFYDSRGGRGKPLAGHDLQLPPALASAAAGTLVSAVLRPDLPACNQSVLVVLRKSAQADWEVVGASRTW